MSIHVKLYSIINYVFGTCILSEAVTGLLKDNSTWRHGSKQTTTAPQT